MSAADLQSLPYPSASDPDNVPLDLKALADAVAPGMVLTFASSAARTSAFTAAGVSPSERMLAWLADVNLYEYYDGTNWLPVFSTIGGARAESGSPYVASGISTTEVNIAALAIENKVCRSGRMYGFAGHLRVNCTVAGDSFAVRIRKDTALSGTEVGLYHLIPKVGGYDHTVIVNPTWKCTSDDTDADFYVSIQRIAGTGTVSVYGQGYTSIRLMDLGAHTGGAAVWTIT